LLTFNYHDYPNDSNEWYTPKSLINKLDIKFDLDPATSVKANEIIKAKKIYTIKDNGLEQDWGLRQKIWLNPPYGKYTYTWLDKAFKETKNNKNEIAILVFSRTDTIWFHELAIKFEQLCFIEKRLRFIKPDTMTSGSSAGAGSLLLSSGKYINDKIKQANLGYITYGCKT
jgi:site-specific DNA-methyltransferase (adenine-specific)